MRSGPRVQIARASASPSAVNSASPAGSAVTAIGSSQPNVLRVDKEGVADPVKPDQEIAESEPPAGSAAASTPPSVRLPTRPPARPGPER